MIVPLKRSQDHLEKLFQKLLFRECIAINHFHSWKAYHRHNAVKLFQK